MIHFPFAAAGGYRLLVFRLPSSLPSSLLPYFYIAIPLSPSFSFLYFMPSFFLYTLYYSSSCITPLPLALPLLFLFIFFIISSSLYCFPISISFPLTLLSFSFYLQTLFSLYSLNCCLFLFLSFHSSVRSTSTSLFPSIHPLSLKILLHITFFFLSSCLNSVDLHLSSCFSFSLPSMHYPFSPFSYFQPVFL